ncbi:hypothetical protein HDZ31DRAFT_65855 [Schizophyllum fasciatum]
MPSPESQPPDRPPSPTSLAPATGAANSGHKRAATPPPEGPARKVITVEPPRDPRNLDVLKIITSLPEGSPTRASLDHALDAFIFVASNMELARTSEGWATVCTQLASAPTAAAHLLQPGDDVDDTRAINHVRASLMEVARSFQGDVEMDAEEPARELSPAYKEHSPTPTPSTRPPPTEPSTREVLLQMQKQFSALNSRLARLEKHAPPRSDAACSPAPPTTATPSSPPTTYAGAVRLAPKQQQQPPPPNPDQKAPQPSNPRYIVRFKGTAPPPEKRDTPLIISHKVNTRLANTPSAGKLRIIGSVWNEASNIVLTFPQHTSLKLIDDHIPSIRAALGLPDSILITHDTPWRKAQLANVYARGSDGELFSDQMILIRPAAENRGNPP